jgi:hypothetical protein
MKHCVVFATFFFFFFFSQLLLSIDETQLLIPCALPCVRLSLESICIGLVKRLGCTEAMENIYSIWIIEGGWRKKEDGLVVFTSRATELLRIIRVRNSVSQQHIVTNRRHSYFLFSFLLSFFYFCFIFTRTHSQTTINHYYYDNNNHKNNDDDNKKKIYIYIHIHISCTKENYA